jgi:hypothetical protein
MRLCQPSQKTHSGRAGGNIHCTIIVGKSFQMWSVLKYGEECDGVRANGVMTKAPVSQQMQTPSSKESTYNSTPIFYPVKRYSSIRQWIQD